MAPLRMFMHTVPNHLPRAASQLWCRTWLLAGLLVLAGPLASQANLAVTTISGGENTVNPYSNSGFLNTTNINSQYNLPYASALDSQGNLYIADRNNHAIRKLTSPTDPAGRTTTFLNLTNKSPIGVAIDGSNSLYVLTLEDNSLRKYAMNSNGVVTGLVLSNHFGAQPSAMTLARDGSYMAYVALTDGSIYSVTPLSVTNLLTTKFKKPAGLAYMPSGYLAVSDSGNNSIWWLYPDGNSNPILLTGQTNLPGAFVDGPAGVAKFNQPAGLAASGDGQLIVADRGNNRVRLISANGSVTNLYGTDSSQWIGDYPGWLDSSQSAKGPPEADLPVSVTISSDGIVYVTELAYHLVRTLTGTGLNSIIPPPSTPSFSPACGYYQGPVTITVYNTLGSVYYTKNGVDPFPGAATLIPTPGGVGTFTWNDSTRDLGVLRIKSFYGTNSSATIHGQVCGGTIPTFSPMSGYFPNGTIITVQNIQGPVFYTVDGSEPAINNPSAVYLPMVGGVGYIAWTNRLHDLGYLRLKGINGIDPSLQSVTVRGIPLSVSTPSFYPTCGYYSQPETIIVTNAVGEVHYTTDGSEPVLASPMVSMVPGTNGYSVGSFVWNNPNETLGKLRVKAFIGETNYSQTVSGQSFCIPVTPVFTPTCGYFPNGQDIVVSAPYGDVYYSTNGLDPTTNSIPLAIDGGIGHIYWTNSLHDLSWLRIKAFNGDVSSDTVSGEPCPVTTPTFSPTCGYFTNCIDITVSNLAGEVHYTVDGSNPTLNSPMVQLTNGVGILRWCDQIHDLSSLQLRAFSGPDNFSVAVTGEICQPTVPVFAPMSGYYPDGISIVATNPIGTIHYTTDGSEPTIDSAQATRMNNGQHLIPWADGLHDLSYLRMKSFAGANESVIASGVSSQVNEIGFTHDYYAGPGSTAVIPVVMNLRPNVAARTILLSVDITPNAPNTNLISTDLQGRRPAATNFVQVLRPVPANGNDFTWATSTLVQNGMTRLLISVTGTNAGFIVQNHAVVALVCVPLPPAPFGTSWRLTLSRVSATTDGKTDLPLNLMPARSLILSNISYVLGDVMPMSWYGGANAFGDGNLMNSDINAVEYAATGIIVPFNDLLNTNLNEPHGKSCDAFNAMDVWPQVGGVPVGDGRITYLDSQYIEYRYWGLDTNVWVRSWNESGKRVTTKVGDSNPVILRAMAQRVSSLAVPPVTGNVWTCQARVSSGTLTNVIPGQLCTFPVYVDVAAGCQLAGMQLVASVRPEGVAPDLDGVQFVPDVGEPQVLDANTPNDVARVYRLVPSPSFNPPLQGRNHLGDIVFQVPLNAQPKQAYTVHFSAVDGAADLQTPYQFESLPATAWVESASQKAPEQVSDEWKMQFFGSTTSAQAQDAADPDGDGMSNLMEYLAGTDPTDSQSRVRFLNPALSNSGAGVVLSWLSAPTKNYCIEWSPNVSGTNWTALANMTGNGTVQQYVDSQAGTQARYYRLRVQAP